MNYNKLYNDLLVCSDRSRLFTTVKAAMVKRKHWKALPRGSYKSSGIVGSLVVKNRDN